MDNADEPTGLEDARRAILKNRDRALGAAPALSLSRLAILTDAVAAEFAVETSIKRAVDGRDQLLQADDLKIPSSVEVHLRRELASAMTRHRAWWNFDWLRLPDCQTGAAVAITCLMFAVVVVSLGKWLSAPRSGPQYEAIAELRARHDPALIQSDERVSLTRLSLRISATELALLQQSFFASNRAGIERPNEETVRLDLLVRPILLNDSVTEIP